MRPAMPKEEASSPSQVQMVNELVELRKRASRLEERIRGGIEEKIPGGETVNYRNLVEQIPAIIYTSAVDEFSTTLFVSPQVKKILGYSLEEYRRDPDIWRKNLHPEDRDRVLAEVSRSIASSTHFSSEYRMIKKDGSVVWLRDEALVVRDPAGKPLYLEGVMIDITGQKDVEAQLSRRDAILDAVAFAAERFLVNSGQPKSLDLMLAKLGKASGVSRVSIFENHMEPNGVHCAIHRHEWVADGNSGQMDQPGQVAFPWVGGGMERWADRMRRGEVIDGLVSTFPETEQRILLPQGTKSILAAPVFVDEDWWGFIGFDECSRERKWSHAEVEAIRTAAGIIGAAIQNSRTRERLDKITDRYHEFADQLPQPVFETDLEGRFSFVNRRSSELFGYSTEELMHGLDAARLFVSGDWDRVQHAVRECLEGHDQAETECTALCKDGSTFPVILHASRIMRGGMPAGMRGIVVPIGKRKEMEDRLRESEERYRLIFNHSPFGVMHFDQKGVVVDCNQKFLELLGTDRASLIGFDMLASLRDPALKFAVLKSLSGEVGYFEGPYRSTTGGKLTFMRCFFSRIDSESGCFLGGLCIAEDVEDRMEAEAALRRSEARYRAIVEAQTELVSRFTREGVLTFVNEAYCRYFGETREELIGHMFWHHVPDEESRKTLKEHIASLGVHNPVASIEHEVLTSDGEIRWQQWTDRAILDEEGNLVDIQAVGRDITERKKAELALQEAHQQLQDIIEFLPDATFVINKDRKVIAWNRAIEEMTGLKKADILGRGNYAHAVPFYGDKRPILIDLVVEDNPDFENAYDFVERKGNTIFGEVFVPKAYGGKGAYLWGTASPLFDGTGQMIGAIQSIRDITERKKAEDAIHRSENQLRFLSSRLLTAHEEERKRIARELHDSIGQSLAAVKFFVETTLKSAETEEAFEIVSSLETLVPMIQNAMQEARRIYTGLRPSMLDDLGIVATIGWFCREFQITYPMIRVESRIGIREEDVPEELKIVIFRVIQEAMNNIAKYSGAESAGLSLLKTGDRLQLSIEDSGTGFDPDAVLGMHPQERGLGLTGMKERTELSGGAFTLHSFPGKGTTITAIWPCSS